PLLILRFPLPAIMFALVLDAADQTIFQALTDLDLTNYQSYDKALDVYYLAIAYISTFRNWLNPVAVLVGLFLWYYRLIGVTLFELTEWRPLLLIFPNTFEYYFIALSVVLLRWSDQRLTRKQVVGIAAGIWIFIKLPQEYWIHIAQLDVTDVVKNDLFGVDSADSWGTAFSNRPAVALAMFLALAVLVAVAEMLWRRTPPADHDFTFDADQVSRFDDRVPVPTTSRRPWLEGAGEKTVLIALLAVIFGRAIPGSNATVFEVFVGVAILVVSNAAVSQWLRNRGQSWGSVATAFFGNLAVNVGLFILVLIFLPSDDEESSGLAVAFFLFLLSLVIALFDRYRRTRVPLQWSEDVSAPA
ncbi:hypothetical protein, partial [Ilumatobacter sp.]|uniref:hypothetical protein n=1 Tax=Ilumatobacter sp. TaxID=1967498 RepID=UPI003AF4E1CF